MPSLIKLGLVASILWTTISAEVIIGHDEVMPFSQAYRPDHDVLLKYKPYFAFLHGCAAFPAVNAAGEVSGGLKPSGNLDQCHSDRTAGQMYARIGFAGNHMGLMYGWYFPEDQKAFANGLRHEWQFVVVWLNSLFDQTAIHLSYTTKGSWREDSHWKSWLNRPLVGKRFEEITTSPDFTSSWHHPSALESNQNLTITKRGLGGFIGGATRGLGKVRPPSSIPGIVGSRTPGRAPIVGATPVVIGGDTPPTDSPMIDWDLLTDSAKLALNVHSWGTRGDQQMFMNDKNFQSSLAAAYFKAFGVYPNKRLS